MTLDNSVSQSLSALASKIKGFVVGQIGSHNSSSTAHSDIRNSIPTTTNQLTNNSGFLTSQDIPEIPKVFYGTSLTEAATSIKEVTTSSNYILSEGTILVVYFDKSQNSSSSVQLKVNNENVIDVICSNDTYLQYKWRAKEVVPFIYDGTNFVMIDSGEATTSYYGVTKLSSSVTNTSTSVAATPSAVKRAYDLASSKADVSDIPTKVSDLTNDSGFLTSQDISGKLNTSDLVTELNNIVLDLIEEGEN